MITAEGLDIYQEQNLILDEVNFAMHKGEFVYIIGRTGTGKSSLLKTLYVDLPLRKGTLRVAGIDISPDITQNQTAALRRKIGIIFQDFQLLFDRTVAENLSFVLKATGWKDRAAIKNRIALVMAEVGLGSVGSKMPFQLSGGEQQRVAIARAMLNEPVLLFADEPTGNLDPEVGFAIMELFRSINRSGTAILMATHNHSFLKELPARILKCEDHKLLDSKHQAVSYIR